MLLPAILLYYIMLLANTNKQASKQWLAGRAAPLSPAIIARATNDFQAYRSKA
jgi:hypothetical protein